MFNTHWNIIEETSFLPSGHNCVGHRNIWSGKVLTRMQYTWYVHRDILCTYLHIYISGSQLFLYNKYYAVHWNGLPPINSPGDHDHEYHGHLSLVPCIHTSVVPPLQSSEVLRTYNLDFHATVVPSMGCLQLTIEPFVSYLHKGQGHRSKPIYPMHCHLWKFCTS